MSNNNVSTFDYLVALQYTVHSYDDIQNYARN